MTGAAPANLAQANLAQANLAPGNLAQDGAHLAAALALAARGLGETWPNPSVGCVVVSADGRVVGRGRTATGGRPHAETVALAMAGEAARGGTAYVTLEPCAHLGQTPPCTDALIAYGVARVVAAAGDPDPRVDGRGFARLRQAGITVAIAPPSPQADAVNAGFFKRVRQGRPLVTLKLATTLDGRIATASGQSRWITGACAREAGHALRADHDAIMVGIGTALADDPDLTCRIPGARTRPLVRVVADRRLRLPPNSRLARSARQTPVWVLHRSGADRRAADALAALGVILIDTGTETGAETGVETGVETGTDISAMLARLGDAGLTRLLVEGGATLAGALLAADLVDRLAWFTAPMILGADAIPAVAPIGVAALTDAKRFVRLHMLDAGPDIVSLFDRS